MVRARIDEATGTKIDRLVDARRSVNGRDGKPRKGGAERWEGLKHPPLLGNAVRIFLCHEVQIWT
jgi:hypothetical protein